MRVSGYRAMWVVVMFDLPVRTKPQRRTAAAFRKDLVRDGFWMLQYSIYARPCASEESAAVYARRTRVRLPALGQVRILRLTDKQFSRMELHVAGKVDEMESMPDQLELF